MVKSTAPKTRGLPSKLVLDLYRWESDTNVLRRRRAAERHDRGRPSIAVIDLSADQFMEADKIASGAYAPLDRFMGEADFHSVVNDMRLCSGAIFPIPIVLDVDAETVAQLRTGDDVTLVHEGRPVGSMRIDDLFSIDRKTIALDIFGSEDGAHAGVKQFKALKETFVGGPVKLAARPATAHVRQELLPGEARQMFKDLGWRTIAAFHTRNVPHRAHEWIHRLALDQCDGLFIHPILGRKKAGDFTDEAVVVGYEALVSKFFPPDRVRVSPLSIAARYGGPREAVFHALVRRNFGCTHMIIGRDHAGVGDYYETYASQDLCIELAPELGISIIAFQTPHYCPICEGIVSQKTCPHGAVDPPVTVEINGSDLRMRIAAGDTPENHLMRAEVLESLRGVDLFVR